MNEFDVSHKARRCLTTFVFVVMQLSFGLSSSATVAAEPIDFVTDVRPIFDRHCVNCHGAKKQKSGFRLDVKSLAFKSGDGFAPNIVPGKAAESPLIKFVSGLDRDMQMPPAEVGTKLSAREVEILKQWINSGAVWPEGVDRVQLQDPRTHWAFQPVVKPKVPTIDSSAALSSSTEFARWPRHDLDRFVLSKLLASGLKPSPVTTPTGWLRRVTWDLVGLPPTIDEVRAFEADLKSNADPEAAYRAVVDRLLQSPRYGERWAQHWLDLVRYADTHGFEVNTERPNAWPYRDYVIDAFNADTPFDQFIREQIIGDQLGRDAATGFLVTASVLLPGQIGKDEPSIRLARQDSLDEIVVNVGQTFLGLSIGCARCHDHKFDPISQRDYYSMQAFFAGVLYEDRPIMTSETQRRRQDSEQWKEEVARIEQMLEQFVPLARPVGQTQRRTDAKQNVESFEPTVAKFVRFTIHDANLHPTLGLIEPCLDEFEIYTAEEPARNVALSSLGTKVTASGSRSSPHHQLAHVNDGQYGNAHSWMSDQAGRGWVQFELPQPQRIQKIVWGRDRLGQFNDRLATAFTLEVGESLDALRTVAAIHPLRPSVKARRNVDRFEPIKTQRVRFSFGKTNRLEACLDELEVMNREGLNVALASRGTTAKSSGDTVSPNNHELRFLNDGQYGNARSWMSNASQDGWVELQWGQPELIDRVVWGRDREGKYNDRLPIDYRIEVWSENDSWRVVVSSQDRQPYSENESTNNVFSMAGLTDEDRQQAQKLLERQRQLQTQINAAMTGDKAFAGRFRQPDVIHVLHRGDPEQPKDKVDPSMPQILASLAPANVGNSAKHPELPDSTSLTEEQRRRRSIALWLSSPENPLTARVLVNRVWQAHFGVGLVDTPSDFGLNGSKPSHPELLDWLAADFVQSHWSIKQLHRSIVLSATYRQASQIDSVGQQKDADVRLLWRYPARRLDAEQMRDGMLVVSGRLDSKMYGRGFDLFDKRGGLTGFKPVESFSGDGLRRMIYAHKVRREREAVFGAFDCPDAGQSTARRRESTTPIQALNLFNSQFTIDESAAFAARIMKEVGSDARTQVRRAYELALTREPTVAETTDAESVVTEHGLATLCRVLFNSNEFLLLP